MAVLRAPIARPLPPDVELQRVLMTRLNVLLVGDDAVAELCLESIRPALIGPVVTHRPSRHLNLWAMPARTVILQRIDNLTLQDQHNLNNWMHLTKGVTQVISTSASSVLPLVDRGAFLRMLYYRLNTICVELT